MNSIRDKNKNRKICPGESRKNSYGGSRMNDGGSGYDEKKLSFPAA